LRGCEHRHPAPRTQLGSANWADTFKVAVAATQKIPASTQAIRPVAGSRAMANRTSASAVPTVAPVMTRSAPALPLPAVRMRGKQRRRRLREGRRAPRAAGQTLPELGAFRREPSRNR
jgi:hypothetical protein